MTAAGRYKTTNAKPEMTQGPISSMSIRFGQLALRWLFCLLVALGVLSARGHAQDLSLAQFNHTAWTTKDGAPVDVWALAQTPDGWLWLGGSTGLYRFDGIRFEHVNIEGLDPRRSNAVSMLYASESGALWIGYVNGGLSVLKHGRFTYFGEREGLGRGTVITMAEDARGDVWVACANGLWRYDGRKWTRIGSDWGFPDPYATTLFVDQQGTVWVAGEHEIFSLQRQSRRFQPTGMRIRGGDSGEFEESPDGRAWFADETGIHVLPGQDTSRPRAAASNARTSYIRLIDRTGHVWRTDGVGVRRFPFNPSHGELLFKDVSDADSFGAKGGLSSGIVKTVLEDRDGNIWLGTDAGVDRFRRVNVHQLAPPVDQFGGTALAPADDGSIWIGTVLGNVSSPLDGLWKYDGTLKRIPVAGLTKVTAVDTDVHGSLWIAGPEGVWRQEGPEQFRKVAELPKGTRGQEVHALTVDLDGNPWISVVRSGLFRYRDGIWERNGNLPALPDRRPYVQALDHEGRLWIGYGNGTLAIVERDRVKLLGAADGLDVGGIVALHVGAHTVVAGANRVSVLDQGRFHDVTTPADPAVLSGVTGILESKDGDLWLAGLKGAVRVSKADLDRAMQNQSFALPFELFDDADGFPGIAHRMRPVPTIIQGSDGRLWFAGQPGIGWLDPAHIQRNPVPPSASIRSVTATGQTYSAPRTLSLTAGTRDLQVDYTALDLSRPDRIRFRYRLDGLDKDWVDAGSRRQAFYTHLDPGRYHFRVAASNEGGNWSKSTAGLEIVIPPTFVQTRMFASLCVASALAMLWLAYILRMRQLTNGLRYRLEERIAERERIARELHDTLLQGMQGLILKFQAATEEIPPGTPARRNMEQALDRADDILIEGRDRVKDLRISPASSLDLPQAIGTMGTELSEEYAIRFNLSVEGTPRPLDPIVQEEALRIAHEALTNAFHHARAAKIETEIIYHRAELRLRFRDDGCGIDSSILKLGRPDHWGLPGMRERARNIRATLEVWSRQEAGTEIELRVPARTAFARKYLRRGWWLGSAVRVES